MGAGLVRATSVMPLQQAYSLARVSAPELAIARYRVDGAKSQRDVARGRVMPQVSVFGQWSENRVEYRGGLIPDQRYPGERYGFQASQSLINMSSWMEYDRQKALVGLSEQELKITESQLLGLVAGAYLAVLLSDADLAQFETELEALEQQLKEANALYERSLLPITQVLETQTRADTLRADVIAARGQAAIARESLIALVGTRDIEPMAIAEQVSLDSTAGSAADAAIMAFESSPEVAAAEEGVLAARKSIAREKGSWVPNVDLIVSSQYSDVGFDNLTSPPRTSDSIQISVNYPLFEGGSGSARLRGAWAEFYTAQQQVEAAKRAGETRARSAWVQLQAASERVNAARQAVKTSKTNVDASRKAVKAGTARVTDVLLAMAQNTRAERDLSAARFQRAMGWLELELATGVDPMVLAPRLSNALHRGVSAPPSVQATEEQ
ncbi:TolC family protein [Luminiphilus sp. nBUS_16]|uniref:TolC family protein n=1 Tax=Luminiphilus sp. nBUS_16 TaxID=3395315 RepID=UPI003EBD62B2